MSFAFVIPIVHPEGPRIRDYRRVEDTLRVTLDSLTAQTSDSAFVVVVCHRLPRWYGEYAGKVHFLVIDAHPALPHPIVHIDKGIKMIPGAMFAIERLGATHVMLMDGDDFAHVDLARRVQSGEVSKPGKDGWIVTCGYHVQIRPQDDALAFEAAYEVRRFDRNCGSCRIFLASALKSHIARLAPSFVARLELLPEGAPIRLPRELIDAVVKDSPDTDSLLHPFTVFSNHILQDVMFNFSKVNQPLMAKGCGHGNHDARGDVYWYRVKKQIEIRVIFQDFGIERSTYAVADPLPTKRIATLARAWTAVVREAPKSIVRRVKAYRAN